MKNIELLEKITNGIELDSETQSELVELWDYEDNLFDNLNY